MDGEAVKEIEKLSQQVMSIEIDGKTFARANYSRVIHDPQPEPLRVQSLLALVSYINTMADEGKSPDSGGILLAIESPTRVSIFSKLNIESMKRKLFIVAQLGNAHQQDAHEFDFGNFMEVEEFLIKLRSLFKDSDGRKQLLEFTSRISKTSGVEFKDDGVSQGVQIHHGISGAVKANATAPAIVTLIPYRTFREVDQPQSEFIFRMQQKGERIACALFEADGGAWEIEARARINKWLSDKTSSITILA